MAAMVNNTDPPPIYDRDTDRRLTVLETRFDTILPTLATKADLLELRAEMKSHLSQFEAKMSRWMTGMLITLFVSQAGTVLALVTILRPS